MSLQRQFNFISSKTKSILVPDPQLWIDVPDASKRIIVDDKISQIEDKSANAKIFAPSTESLRPILLPFEVNYLDVASTTHNTSCSLRNSSFSSFKDSSYIDLFVVGYMGDTAITSYQSFLYVSTNASASNIRFSCGFIKISGTVRPAFRARRIDTDALTTINSTVAVSVSEYYIFHYSFSCAAGNKYFKIYVDNVLNYEQTTSLNWTEGLTASTNSATASISYSGSSERIGEHRGFSGIDEMTESTRTNIYSALKSKWGL